MSDEVSKLPSSQKELTRKALAEKKKSRFSQKRKSPAEATGSVDDGSPMMVNGRPAGEMTVSDIFGQAVWLMTQSPAHRNLFLSDLEWMVMPALLLRQFRVFPGKEQPIGLALWGKVSDEADARLQTGNVRMSPGDWNSGENYWLLELLAPFGHRNEMLADLQKTIFKGKTFKMHSLEKGERSLVTLAGKGAKLNTPPKDATDEPKH